MTETAVPHELALFVTDDGLHQRIAPHLGRDQFRAALKYCERYLLFPRIHPLWRGRYWPSVRAWLDRNQEVGSNDFAESVQDGPETSMSPPGKAPGLKRGRNRQPYWIARQVVRDPLDFPDKCIRLPAEADDATLAELCHEHTARLQSWLAEQKQRGLADAQQAGLRTRYNGTVLSACRIYQEHRLSSFHSIKHNTRRTYLKDLRMIEATVGARLYPQRHHPRRKTLVRGMAQARSRAAPVRSGSTAPTTALPCSAP